MTAVFIVFASLASGFINPPDSAKPHTWWHWMNGNVTKAGITADLEAMHEIGLGGAQMFDVDYGIPEGPVSFNSTEWRDCVRYAARECERLGLELVLNTASGWSAAGAPWNKIENGMKCLAMSEVEVKGPCLFSATLPEIRVPGARFDERMTTEMIRRDIAVLAYPTPKSGSARPIDDFFRRTCAASESRDVKWLEEHVPLRFGLIDSACVTNLTARFGTTGRLVWDVPDGRWTILRVGWSTNGRRNYPASKYGQGYECDKLDYRALDAHWKGLMDEILPVCGAAVKGIVIDSYEAGPQNWTDGFERTFEKNTGYSIIPYLPVFAGQVIGSTERSKRFLEDFHRVISKTFVENFGRASKQKANAKGLILYLEPYGNSTCNNIEYARCADIPMTEFWTTRASTPHWRGDPPYGVTDAHVWGKTFVGAEAYTTWPKDDRWTLEPREIKAMTDYQYCRGINRIIYHTYAHQPWTDDHLRPGMTMGRFGIMFNRNVTWWEQGDAWIRYQTRCQYMLQQGRAFADVFFYQGPDTRAAHFKCNRDVGNGSECEVLSTEALLNCKAKNGWLTAPSGEHVRYLMLPQGSDVQSVVAMRKLDEITRAGVTLIGQPPTRAYGLVDSRRADRIVRSLAETIWTRTNVFDRTWVDTHAGKVHPGFELDFELVDYAPDGIMHTHRVADDGSDIYFVARQANDAARISCSFRVTGRCPELWDPESGSMCVPREWHDTGSRTQVTIPFSPQGAVFVVFPRSPTPGVANEIMWRVVDETPFSGSWNVSFDRGRDGMDMRTFPHLVSWTTDADEAIRYFSGRAVYRSHLTIGKPSDGERVILSLGLVKNLATIAINGKTVGTLWKEPFEIDVGNQIVSGTNRLEITVANLWVNRLVGDAKKPEDLVWDESRWNGPHLMSWPLWIADPSRRTSGRTTFATWRHWTADDKPLESGLLGPVRIRRERRDDR